MSRADIGRDPGPEGTIGGLGLRLRGLALEAVERAFPIGNLLGAAGMFAMGGFVPVLGGWLDDRVSRWDDVVTTLGGVRPKAEACDPDGDHGPVLGRADAPELFDEVTALARRAGAKPPGQIRLAYLPCCGATAWGRRGRALLIGLPLLSVLNRVELRAVLAHEMAHLARGDATHAARSARFVEALGRALDDAPGPSRSPLRGWAALCFGAGSRLLAPIARGQESRADRFAAGIAGGDATASALVKVALVQPIFREVLEHYDPDSPGLPNLYASFRSFWQRLPEDLLTAMRHRALSDLPSRPDAAHPPLIDRLAVVHAYPSRPASDLDLAPSESLLGDPSSLEQMLHNRLFGLVPSSSPSVFHRSGS